MQRSWGNSPSMMVCDGSVGWRRRSWQRRRSRWASLPLSDWRGRCLACGTLAAASSFSGHTDWRHAMDKDRIKGSAQQAKGKVKVKVKVKEVAGKVTGDKKLEGEGKADKVGGKSRNAVGSMKDALRGK